MPKLNPRRKRKRRPQPAPNTTEPYDSRRAVERAQSQYYNGDSTQYTGIDSFGGSMLNGGNPTGLPLNVLGMQGAGSDQASSLAAARSAGLSGMGTSGTSDSTGLMGSSSGSGALGTSGNGITMPTSLSLPSSLDQSNNFGSQQTSQPNWFEQRRPNLSSPFKPDQPELRHRANPYADVPSLYDLYSQYSRRSPVLQRFGADIFQNGSGNVDQLPMDLPAGPDYVIGPGDGLSIDLWGGVSQRLRRVVDREGKIALPEVGDVQVAGTHFGRRAAHGPECSAEPVSRRASRRFAGPAAYGKGLRRGGRSISRRI